MRLACITVPNFHVVLERGRAPHLVSQPLAIGEPPPGTNEVLDCSPEAAVLGVRIGMPLRDARTVAPELIVIPPDPVFYARAFDELLDALEDAEPAIEAEGAAVFAAVDQHADEQAQWHAATRLVEA